MVTWRFNMKKTFRAAYIFVLRSNDWYELHLAYIWSVIVVSVSIALAGFVEHAITNILFSTHVIAIGNV